MFWLPQSSDLEVDDPDLTSFARRRFQTTIPEINQLDFCDMLVQNFPLGGGIVPDKTVGVQGGSCKLGVNGDVISSSANEAVIGSLGRVVSSGAGGPVVPRVKRRQVRRFTSRQPIISGDNLRGCTGVADEWRWMGETRFLLVDRDGISPKSLLWFSAIGANNLK
ncbi:unnamed protein product [Linum trigynum]|uniref:Uncharacterized protein n=1 Tax=Linum trigynum TaxID=586398 RepID=A0AAV2F3W6_9ROSI